MSTYPYLIPKICLYILTRSQIFAYISLPGKKYLPTYPYPVTNICHYILTWSQIFAYISLPSHKYLPPYPYLVSYICQHIFTWSHIFAYVSLPGHTPRISFLPAHTQGQSKKKEHFFIAKSIKEMAHNDLLKLHKPNQCNDSSIH